VLALLPTRDADRRFTPVTVSRARLELPQPIQLRESEVGVDEAMRGKFVGENRELGDIRFEKFRDGLAKRRERTPADGRLTDNFAKKSLERFDELARGVIHSHRLVVEIGSYSGQHRVAYSDSGVTAT
jgi:hypothetical protein